jgi:hypothetical protein
MERSTKSGLIQMQLFLTPNQSMTFFQRRKRNLSFYFYLNNFPFLDFLWISGAILQKSFQTSLKNDYPVLPCSPTCIQQRPLQKLVIAIVIFFQVLYKNHKRNVRT